MKTPSKKLIFQVQFDTECSPYNGKQQQSIYIKKYTQLREKLIDNLQQFVSMDVVPKQPPRHFNHLLSKKGNNLYHDLKHNKLVNFPRRDSFEVSVDGFLIFSRLQTGGWPDPNALTEWALRVTEKIMELEPEQGQPNKSNKDIQQKSVKGNKTSRRNSIVHESIDGNSKWRQDEAIVMERLPPLRQSVEKQRVSMASNYATVPVKRQRNKSRYSEEKPYQGQLPSKVEDKNLIDFQATKYFTNRRHLTNKRNKADDFKSTVYFADSKPKHQSNSFHWNFGTPRSISRGRTTIRVNDQNPKKDIYRQKNVELSPLPGDLRAQQDRFFSEKKTKEKQGNIEKAIVALSESVLNCHRKAYDIQGNRIKKIYKNSCWSPLLCEDPLPLKGQYYFSFAVLRSSENMIQVGIAPLCYYPKGEESEGQDQIVSYDCSSGMTKDCKLEQRANRTAWRLGGEAAPRNTPFQMRIVLDTQNQFIDWYIEESIVASSKLPSIYRQGFRPFFSLFNSDDSVLLNEEGWKDELRLGKFDKVSYFLEKKPSQHSQQSHHSEAGKIKRFTPNPSNKEQSSLESEKLVESGYLGNLVPITMDQQVQTEFIGRIKRQRVLKYIEKKGKGDAQILTDNQKSNEPFQPRKDPELVNSIEANQDKQPQNTNLANPIRADSEYQWNADYHQEHGFELTRTVTGSLKPEAQHPALLINQFTHQTQQLPSEAERSTLFKEREHIDRIEQSNHLSIENPCLKQVSPEGQAPAEHTATMPVQQDKSDPCNSESGLLLKDMAEVQILPSHPRQPQVQQYQAVAAQNSQEVTEVCTWVKQQHSQDQQLSYRWKAFYQDSIFKLEPHKN